MISSEVKEGLSSWTKAGRIKLYVAEVLYEYSVHGERYSSDLVSFGEFGSHNTKNAQRIVDEYPAGKSVVVYYDPDNPDVAVLRPGGILSVGAALVLLVGSLFFGFGLWGILAF